MYQSVMKHSESYMQQHKDKNGKTCMITSNKINISNYQTIHYHHVSFLITYISKNGIGFFIFGLV